MPVPTVFKIRSTMLCLSGFELYSRWLPLTVELHMGEPNDNKRKQ